ncbi:MAG: polysaccharide deacetylase family protein [Eubacteriales bacterium]|nr:polysaccharide deacetylase family protein [Eubacteriales bacterium]
MIKDFYRLIQSKLRHSAVFPSIQAAVCRPAFKACLFLLGVFAFAQACLLLAPPAVTASGASVVNGRALPIFRVQTGQNKVALSFDCTYGSDDIQTILNLLREKNVHATFFVTGSWVKSCPDQVQAILDAGHDLGSYGENYQNMTSLSREQKRLELQNLHRRVRELYGYEMNLFRLPYGEYDNETIAVVRECGYFPVQWSVDSLDWKDYGAADITERVLKNEKLENGAILLCHSGAKYTPDALLSLMEGLQEKGFQIVPVSELILTENYRMEADGTQVLSSMEVQ